MKNSKNPSPKLLKASEGHFKSINHKEDKTMAYKRTEIPELEKAMAGGRKKFVRYEEGARLYSMGLHPCSLPVL